MTNHFWFIMIDTKCLRVHEKQGLLATGLETCGNGPLNFETLRETVFRKKLEAPQVHKQGVGIRGRKSCRAKWYVGKCNSYSYSIYRQSPIFSLLTKNIF